MREEGRGRRRGATDHPHPPLPRNPALFLGGTQTLSLHRHLTKQVLVQAIWASGRLEAPRVLDATQRGDKALLRRALESPEADVNARWVCVKVHEARPFPPPSPGTLHSSLP